MRTFAVAVTLAGVGALLPLSIAHPAGAANVPCTKVVPNDLNNDGKADVVIGNPKAVADGVANAGAVDIRITGGTSYHVSAGSTGLGAVAAELGASVAMGYLNDDCFADLLVGAPGAAGGRVIYYPGSTEGIDAAKGMILQSDNPGGTDRFGTSVAIGQKVAFVGAPDADPNNVKNAGRVYTFTHATDTFTSRGMLQQGTSPIKDTLEAGDRFGQVLAYHGNVLAVGAPLENIVSATDAGALHLTTMNDTEAWKPETDLFLNQDSPGVTGTAEKGDNFGAAVYDQARAVGVPGEDVKDSVDAGGIYTQLQTMTTNAPALRWVSQSTKGVPGKSKANDRFGSALASGLAYLCPTKTSVAVGIPGKTVSDKSSAGMVTVVAEAPSDCGTTVGRQITQDTSGIAGKSGKLNEFGKAFVSVPVADAASDGLLAGSPGSNLDGLKDTGRVVSVLNLPKTNLRSLGGTQAMTYYGSVTTQR